MSIYRVHARPRGKELTPTRRAQLHGLTNCTLPSLLTCVFRIIRSCFLDIFLIFSGFESWGRRGRGSAGARQGRHHGCGPTAPPGTCPPASRCPRGGASAPPGASSPPVAGGAHAAGRGWAVRRGAAGQPCSTAAAAPPAAAAALPRPRAATLWRVRACASSPACVPTSSSAEGSPHRPAAKSCGGGASAPPPPRSPGPKRALFRLRLLPRAPAHRPTAGELALGAHHRRRLRRAHALTRLQVGALCRLRCGLLSTSRLCGRASLRSSAAHITTMFSRSAYCFDLS